jgi:hypothetical protein
MDHIASALARLRTINNPPATTHQESVSGTVGVIQVRFHGLAPTRRAAQLAGAELEEFFLWDGVREDDDQTGEFSSFFVPWFVYRSSTTRTSRSGRQSAV